MFKDFVDALFGSKKEPEMKAKWPKNTEMAAKRMQKTGGK